jgi:hypothetical protein
VTVQGFCITDGHEQIPAVAVLVYCAQGAVLGELLCRHCCVCKVPGCGRLGDVYDSGYREPYCQRHADQFPVDEAPHGPDIVELGSARHTELLTHPDTRTT